MLNAGEGRTKKERIHEKMEETVLAYECVKVRQERKDR